ncbi:hypothetical protein [Ktedonospora formicarum]|uniref:Uncharacterized protein n=1 Tax=Ktedonospora formicarum TaxID=2778364 RepID=A0A8J3MV18_9CHLR|nr:hypothetical protein [Ktedonospora formicarum]GHO47188.1 hypothetical protein KSX_53510 [Ktedonospora formicarum]
MTTKKQLQDIVKQLELVDLGEAQYYWEKERTHMTTMQELQAIVEQLGLVDLGEAQQYWEQGNMDEDVKNKKRKQFLSVKANNESLRNAA